MKRLAQVFAKLYPRRWRARYGEEFDALLEEAASSPQSALSVLSGAILMQIRFWSTLTILAAGALVGVLAGFGITATIPKSYRSEAVIELPDGPLTQETLRKIESIANESLDQSSLTQFIASLDLYRAERANTPMADVVEHMRRSISILPVNTGADKPAAIQVRFVYSDPRLAQRVTQGLTSRFLEANLKPGARTTMQALAPASLPQKAIAPRPSRNVLMGLTLGVTLGAMVAFFPRRRTKVAEGEI